MNDQATLPTFNPEQHARSRARIARDYYGELGCCLTCTQQLKEYVQGLQLQVYYNGKYYDCLCLEGKCSRCVWLFAGECQRERGDTF